MIIDPPSASVLLRQMALFAQQATDTLLVYYAGHGIKSSSADGLFLATVETTEAHCHLDGVEFHKIRQIIYQSPAAKKILIFDCCYSGEITADEMGGDVDTVVAASIGIRGTYSIASAPRNNKAYAPPEATYTAFSGELISVLEGGIKEQSDFLTLNRIYDEVRNRIALNPKLPKPQRKIESDEGEFVFARNAYWSPGNNTRINEIEQKYKMMISRLRTEIEHKDIEIKRRIAETEELRFNSEKEIKRITAENEERLRDKKNEMRRIVEKYEQRLMEVEEVAAKRSPEADDVRSIDIESKVKKETRAKVRWFCVVALVGLIGIPVTLVFLGGNPAWLGLGLMGLLGASGVANRMNEAPVSRKAWLWLSIVALVGFVGSILGMLSEGFTMVAVPVSMGGMMLSWYLLGLREV